jgi:predicted helicase
MPFQKITPDKNNNWINLAEDSDWDSLLPVCSKEKGQNAIFAFSSLGVSTNRDEWVYDFDKATLENKMNYFIDTYNSLLEKKDTSWKPIIKWSRVFENYFQTKKSVTFNPELINKIKLSSIYYNSFWYAEKLLNDMLTQNHYSIFGEKLSLKNKTICFSGLSSSKWFQSFAVTDVFSLDFLEKTQCLPLYRYEKGERVENITDWALEQFRAHYKTEDISKESIFCYIYAVLHNPAYRQKYELNLKRDFPRIPFYNNFGQWAAWGKELMDLHIGYETIEPYPLVRKDIKPKEGKPKVPNLLSALEPSNPLLENADEYTFVPKAKLKADKEQGLIMIDDLTTLMGVPVAAWEYKLGNRCALEWVLDQYKEGKPSDPTIAERFNTYRFADYKEFVIDLLMRVCRVSVETMRIVDAMKD